MLGLLQVFGDRVGGSYFFVAGGGQLGAERRLYTAAVLPGGGAEEWHVMV